MDVPDLIDSRRMLIPVVSLASTYVASMHARTCSVLNHRMLILQSRQLVSVSIHVPVLHASNRRMLVLQSRQLVGVSMHVPVLH